MSTGKPSKYDTLQAQIDGLLKKFADLEAVVPSEAVLEVSEVDNSEIEAKIDELDKKIDNIANNYTIFETNVKGIVAALQEKVKEFESNDYYLKSQKEQSMTVGEFLHDDIEEEQQFESDVPVDRNGKPLKNRGTEIKKDPPAINMS